MSNEAKHTPGPWVFSSHQMKVRTKAGATVAELFSNACKDQEQMRANARLIAAAPELLDENIEARTLLGLACVLALQGDLKGVQEIARKLKIGMRGGCPFIESSAIAKAEGAE